MLASTRSLLTGIIDFAGTFPPASLSLDESMAKYHCVRSGTEHWLLGRFIVPAAGLTDFDARSAGARDWPVSVVLGAEPTNQLAQTLQLIERHPTYRVASVEFPPLGPSEIAELSDAVPDAIEAFFEVPFDAHIGSRINAIAASESFAKVRTGGIAAGAFPGAEGFVRVMEACSDAGVALKATAGLHHALRGSYALTYEPGSQMETMHGFLNVAVAAAMVHAWGESLKAVNVLHETSVEAFDFRADGVVWNGQTISADDLAASRRLLFRSFGSCSVQEPIDELARLRLL